MFEFQINYVVKGHVFDALGLLKHVYYKIPSCVVNIMENTCTCKDMKLLCRGMSPSMIEISCY